MEERSGVGADSPEEKSGVGSDSPVHNGVALFAETTVEQVPALNQTVLQIENEMRKKEMVQLKSQLEVRKHIFSFSQIEQDVEKVQYFTGLPDAPAVQFLEDLLNSFDLVYHSGWVVQKIPLREQLLMTLMKLRLNLADLDLATRFNCGTDTVTNVVITIISSLYDTMYVRIMEGNIPSRNTNLIGLPDCFVPFQNCRMVLDCVDFAVSNTENLETQGDLYCQYNNKRHTTMKTLIGLAPNGVITYVSDLYSGSTSDKAITADCGVLDYLQPGDLVLANKGFAIQDIVPPGVTVNTPSLLANGQLTLEDVVNNRKIASARNHVEHSIRTLKLFSILEQIPDQYEKYMNKILKVCVCLTNLQTPTL